MRLIAFFALVCSRHALQFVDKDSQEAGPSKDSEDTDPEFQSQWDQARAVEDYNVKTFGLGQGPQTPAHQKASMKNLDAIFNLEKDRRNQANQQVQDMQMHPENAGKDMAAISSGVVSQPSKWLSIA